MLLVSSPPILPSELLSYNKNLFLRRWPRFNDGVPPGEGVAIGDSEKNDFSSRRSNQIEAWTEKWDFKGTKKIKSRNSELGPRWFVEGGLGLTSQ